MVLLILIIFLLQDETTGVMCIWNNNDVLVTSFKANGRTRPVLKGSLTEGSMLLYKSYGNGIVHCSFRRSIAAPRGSEFYMLDLSQNQYALWAAGPLAADSLPSIHEVRGATGRPIDIRFMVCYTLEMWFKSYESITCFFMIPFCKRVFVRKLLC